MKNEWLRRRQLKLQTNSNVRFVFEVSTLNASYRVAVKDLAKSPYSSIASGVWLVSESPNFQFFTNLVTLNTVFASDARIKVIIRDPLTGIDHPIENWIVTDPMMVGVGRQMRPVDHVTEYLMCLDCSNKSTINSKYFKIK